MKPPPFAWHAPDSVEEALSLLAEHGDEAKVLAGGQSLIPVLNFRLARPAVLVDLNRIPSLTGIRAANGGLHVGAMTRQREAERSRLVAERAPLMAEALVHVAHPQIRNRGTIGGSLAHADPAAELPAIALVLDATFHLRSAAAERTVPAHEFFRGLFTTALEPDEIVTGIEFPSSPAGSGWAFDEVARRHGDYALMGVAALIVCDRAGVCREARLAYVNAGPGPVRATKAERQLIGEVPDDRRIREAAAAAGTAIRPGSDVHASAEYRRQLARVLTERVLRRAIARTTA